MSGFQIFAADTTFQNRAARDFFTPNQEKCPIIPRFLPESLARWWPDTLPEFGNGGWWHRPNKRVRYRQCEYSLAENSSFISSKCQKVLPSWSWNNRKCVMCRHNRKSLMSRRPNRKSLMFATEQTFVWKFLMNWNETKFEIFEIFGFWREISNITCTLLYFFPAKKISPLRGQLHSILDYGNDILETRVWEANEDQR